MNRTSVRYHMLDTMASPRYIHPRPRMHRKRHKPEYVDGYQIQGKDTLKLIGLEILFMVTLFLIWWYGGK